MKDYQTPQKEHSRYSDIGNRRSKESQLKKAQKVAKKSLNGAFSTVSVDVSPQISKDSCDFSSISEGSETNHGSQIAESSVLAASPFLSPSLEIFSPSDLTPTSKIATFIDESDNAFAVRRGNNKSESFRRRPAEADIVENPLKQALTQVLRTNDVDDRSKKLLEALIELVLKECCDLPAEIDGSADLVSVKARIILLIFLIWCLGLFMIFFLFSFGLARAYDGPSPT